MTMFRKSGRRGTRAGRVLSRPRDRSALHRRHPQHHAWTRARRPAHVAVRQRTRGAAGCAAPFARNDLQGCGRGPESRRRQSRADRRSRDRQERGAVPRARPLHRLARRPLHHRRGCRHDGRRHGVHLQETDRVVGVHRVHGGSGDPSPFTALGTLEGIRACLRAPLRSRRTRQAQLRRAGRRQRRLPPRRAAARARRQGVRHRHQRRARRAASSSASAPKPYRWTRSTTSTATCFAPCALGGVINEDTVPRLRCKIVAGSANNQLQSERVGHRAREARHPLRARLSPSTPAA